MLTHEFFESAQADIQSSAVARLCYYSLARFCYNNRESGKSLLRTAAIDSLDGVTGDHDALLGSDFDAPGAFRKVLFVFMPMGSMKVAGKAIALDYDPDRPYWQIVMLQCGSGNMQNISNGLTSTKTMEVVQHELIHILDYRRTKGKLSGYHSKKQNGKEVTKSDYHNDSYEQNAFFHNIAEDLLSRINDLKTNEDIELTLLYSPISRNFPEYVKAMAKTLTGLKRRHWFELSDANRHRATSRLYQLFLTYWQTYDKLVDESKYEKETPEDN